MGKLMVLYAANNTHSAKTALERFYKYSSKFDLRVAAFKKSSPNINIDFTLDYLLSMFHQDKDCFLSRNLEYYKDFIKNQNFDLIISDFEKHTTYLAIELGVRIWQVSSSIVQYAVDRTSKYGSGMKSKYAHIIKDHSDRKELYRSLLSNSERKYVYSHLGDLKNPPDLSYGYEWVRPYYISGSEYKKSTITGLLNNHEAISILDNYDTKLFSNFSFEKYRNVEVKDIDSSDYSAFLKGCNIYACNGNTSHLADAYYNGKFSAVFPIFERDLMVNTILSEKFGTAKMVFNKEDVDDILNETIKVNKNNIKQLHEILEE